MKTTIFNDNFNHPPRQPTPLESGRLSRTA